MTKSNRTFTGFRSFGKDWNRPAVVSKDLDPERTGGKEVLQPEGDHVLVLQPGEGQVLIYPSIRDLTVAELRVVVAELTAEVKNMARRLEDLEFENRIRPGRGE
jgi:hypothetical protein